MFQTFSARKSRSIAMEIRVAQLDVVPRRLVGLDRVIIRTEVRRDADLIAELGLQIGELFSRQIVVAVEFASLEALHRRRAVFGRDEVDDVDLHIGGVMELRVLDHLDVVVGYPLGQREGAVRHQLARLDPVGAQLVDGGLVDRIGRLVGQHFKEVRRRGL